MTVFKHMKSNFRKGSRENRQAAIFFTKSIQNFIEAPRSYGFTMKSVKICRFKTPRVGSFAVKTLSLFSHYT